MDDIKVYDFKTFDFKVDGKENVKTDINHYIDDRQFERLKKKDLTLQDIIDFHERATLILDMLMEVHNTFNLSENQLNRIDKKLNERLIEELRKFLNI